MTPSPQPPNHPRPLTSRDTPSAIAGMWLLPALARVSRFAITTFYRFHHVGGDIPATGPLLLVANHPNALVDPQVVAATAQRPIRFLAKAPLFHYPVLGALVRGAGAIPVYRKQDDPEKTSQNEESFRAVHEALASGAAVGLFPEGLSHNAPALAPLRTGAARMALGAAKILGKGFPIIPVGITYRAKDRFRSRAIAWVGKPVAWDDLSGRGDADPEAVRLLTERIDDALRDVTVNLSHADDRPAVEGAAAIYAAEFAERRSAGMRVAIESEAGEALQKLRLRGDERLDPLFRSVTEYCELLRSIGLTPGNLDLEPPKWAVAHWIVTRLFALVVAAPVAVTGLLLFYLPYWIIGKASRRLGKTADVRSTIKQLGGGVFYILWIVAMVFVIFQFFGLRYATLAAIILPLLALTTIWLLEHWAALKTTAERYLLLQRRKTLRKRLLTRRRDIADDLHKIYESLGET